ncbi:MAG: hypothetical protein KGI05_09605 [Thaumarchaeota archaeon]|nr:hypothetical protein [Nitrososphaerota archaeon]
MRVIEANDSISIQDTNHYTVDVTKLHSGTAVVCPFDKNMKIGLDEKGKVCLAKKAFFFPFRLKI